MVMQDITMRETRSEEQGNSAFLFNFSVNLQSFQNQTLKTAIHITIIHPLFNYIKYNIWV